MSSLSRPTPNENDRPCAVSLQILNELKNAHRGDWSFFDGRTLRNQLDEWQELLRSELRGEDVADQPPRLRSLWGLCPRGGGHWSEHCAPEVPDYCEAS